MRTVLRQLSYVLTAKEKRNGVLLLIIMVVGALTEVVGVGAIPAFIGVISAPDRLLEVGFVRYLYDALAIESPQEMVLWAALGLILVFVFKNLYLTFLAYARARYSTKREETIANRLFRSYLTAPYTFHLQRNTSELLRNASMDTVDVARTVILPLLSILMEAMVLLFIFILLLVVEPILSIFTFIAFGGLTYGFWRVTRKKIDTYATQEQTHRQLAIQAINQGLGGFKDARVLGREGFFLDTFQTSTKAQASAAQVKQLVQALPRLFLETIAILAILGVAILFVVQDRNTAEIVPTLALLAVAVVRMMPSFTKIANDLTAFRWGTRALNVVSRDMMALDDTRDALGEQDRGEVSFTSELRLERVTYQYPGQDGYALRDVSLSIPHRASVGFVGPSGSGKTTIVDVMLGLLTPSSGRVLVDETDVHDRIRGWQRRIGYIPQQIFLIDDSVRRNVAFGREDADIDDAAVWAALEAAQLRELVDSLPEGLDTEVGEQGVRLSGGQRQRIGIARALYHKPEVLIMDEATSALDNQTEHQFIEALRALQHDHTVITIAHRLSTVRDCDTLFMFDEGRLVAQGTYDELMSSSLAFRKMANAASESVPDRPAESAARGDERALSARLRWH